MVAMDILKTPFKPLLKWKKGKLKIGKYIFDNDLSQKGVFRGYYFKYAHTPDNVDEYKRHIDILNSADILNENNRIYPKEWHLIKCAIKGDHKGIVRLTENQEDELEK